MSSVNLHGKHRIDTVNPHGGVNDCTVLSFESGDLSTYIFFDEFAELESFRDEISREIAIAKGKLEAMEELKTPVDADGSAIRC